PRGHAGPAPARPRRPAPRAGPPAAKVSIRIVRRSLDARKGRAPLFRYRLEVSDTPLSFSPPREHALPQRSIAPESDRASSRAPRVAAPRVVVVGSGPAGSFAALRLCEAGVRVTVIQPGKPVQPRR